MKRKKSNKIRYIFDPIYHSNIWFFHNWTREDYASYMKRKWERELLNGNQVGGSVIQLTVRNVKTGNESDIYCLWFDSKDPPSQNIAHEAFHISYRVMKKAGLTLSEESEEAFAYHLTWLIDEVSKIID